MPKEESSSTASFMISTSSLVPSWIASPSRKVFGNLVVLNLLAINAPTVAPSETTRPLVE